MNNFFSAQLRNKVFAVIGVSLLAVSFSVVLTGCDDDMPVETSTPPALQNDAGQQDKESDSSNKEYYEKAPTIPKVIPKVSFDVPKGWLYRNEQDQGGPFGATLDVKDFAPDDETDHIVSYMVSNVFVGDEKEAERLIRHYAECYDENGCPVGDDWVANEYKEIPLSCGINLYAAIHAMAEHRYVYYSRDTKTDKSWGSMIAFSKGGYVFEGEFSDRPDFYIPELTKMICSFKVEENK